MVTHCYMSIKEEKYKITMKKNVKKSEFNRKNVCWKKTPSKTNSFKEDKTTADIPAVHERVQHTYKVL